jgi:predicted restriction endonuclease
VEGFLGVLADEQAAIGGLVGDTAGGGYVSDLAEFDTDESEARLEDALREHMNAEPPSVVEAHVRRVKRDRRLVHKLKTLYAGKCQRCQFTFTKKDGTPYAEAAHINRIAERLPGIDSPDNIVILCANCHRMLDYGTLEIAWDEAMDAPVAILDGGVNPLPVNKHIRTEWEPAHEWAVASQTDVDW